MTITTTAPIIMERLEGGHFFSGDEGREAMSDPKFMKVLSDCQPISTSLQHEISTRILFAFSLCLLQPYLLQALLPPPGLHALTIIFFLLAGQVYIRQQLSHDCLVAIGFGGSGELAGAQGNGCGWIAH